MQAILSDFLKDRVAGNSKVPNDGAVLPRVLSKVRAYKEARRGGFSDMYRD